MTQQRVISVATGSRAEFGLLRPVMKAIDAHERLALQVVAMGAHLLPPAETINEVAAEFDLAATIPMQEPDTCERGADAAALGRGVSGFAAYLARAAPQVVLVLGDRIEAFAAAAAASVAGVHVAHMHGGDRAPGIADESIRHAITKLAHMHLAATASSVERLIAMGEEPRCVHLVGSPAIDGLDAIDPMDDEAYLALGRPEILLLLHPVGAPEDEEWANAHRLLGLCQRHGRTLALHPNHDPGRAGIMRAIEASGVAHEAHLPRDRFIGLLRRVKAIVGNSSAGLIECAALGVWSITVGPRQAGREMPGHVVEIPDMDFGRIDMALEDVQAGPPGEVRHSYGRGEAGPRTADVLAGLDLAGIALAKRNTY